MIQFLRHLIDWRDIMKKIKVYKGFVIAEASKKEIESGSTQYEIYTTDEWSYGSGMRYAESEAGSIQEATDFIDSY